LVDIGHRNDYPATGIADLLINGVKYFATGTPAPAGNWSTYTATYTGTAADAGDSITVQLNASGAQGDFDNVRLTDNLNSVPEPGFGVILGLGFVALIATIKRNGSH
jgi:hypothetical protein